jgi:hypothetical protein
MKAGRAFEEAVIDEPDEKVLSAHPRHRGGAA